jgi:hypothetical protein
MKYNIDQEVASKLSGVDKKHLFDLYARNNGYIETPPTISEFITNTYYLGESLNKGDAVFDFWKKQLIDIYPTPFFETNKYKVVLLSGATGIGKCMAEDQEMEFYMSEEDIAKYGLEEYVE